MHLICPQAVGNQALALPGFLSTSRPRLADVTHLPPSFFTTTINSHQKPTRGRLLITQRDATHKFDAGTPLSLNSLRGTPPTAVVQCS
jgi:hypothetical protein